jgi:putative hemolysin
VNGEVTEAVEYLGLIPVILGLYGLSATFSGSEAALFSLKPHDIEKMGDRAAKVRSLLERPRRLLIVILFSNLVVNTFAASLTESVAEHFFAGWGLPLAIAFGGFMVLVFGEVTPQTFALRHNVGFSLFVLPFISLLEFLGRPVVSILLPITQALTRRFEGAKDEHVTEEDIRHLVSQSEDHGALDGPEKRWIHSIFELDKKHANDVMVPREKITALPKEVDFATALETIRRTGLSRIPLYVGTLDHIIGVVYAKDLLAARARGQEVKPARIAREPVFVPRWKRCDMLLNELRSRKTHMAIVVDEFGSTAGIITLENLLEILVGKIRDKRREARA